MLITDYRPVNWDQIVGHESIIASLRALVEGTELKSRAFLFHGPPGIGKTTIARVLGKHLGGTYFGGPTEVDAGKDGGIDQIRALVEREQSPFDPMGNQMARHVGNSARYGYRTIIVDEAHALSNAAGRALLKHVEEPPEGVVWVFCTTLPEKVDKALKSRCTIYALNPIPPVKLQPWLKKIAGMEGVAAKKTDNLIRLVLIRCEGLPRTALTMLSAVIGCDDMEEAAKILDGFGSAQESELDAGIQLCRLLAKRPDKYQWAEACRLLQKIEHKDAVGVRIMMERYFANMAINVGKADSATHPLSILENWSSVPYGMDARSALVLVVGKSIL